MPWIEAGDVEKMASGQWSRVLDALAPELHEALERPGRHVPCPVHGGKDGFRLYKDVEETGGGICNSCGAYPSGFSLLMWLKGWEFVETLGAVSEVLGMRDQGMRPPIRQTRPAAAAPKCSDEDLERIRLRLRLTWDGGVPITDRRAEPARLYLARRGLRFLNLPECLRCHPALPYYEDGKCLGSYPAILALVSGSDEAPVTIHRTYVTAEGFKAPVVAPKKLMQYCEGERDVRGGAIRLDQVDAGGVLGVCEGLETALAIREATGMPVWAATTARLLSLIEIPQIVTSRVVVWGDKDRPVKAHPRGTGLEMTELLLGRIRSQGLTAKGVFPKGEIPAGRKSVDWLDIYVQHGPGAFPSLEELA